MEEGIQLYQKAEVAIQKAHSLLINQQTRHGKARENFDVLVDSIEKNGMSEDMYLKITDEIKRYTASKKKFNLERIPFTSALSDLAQPFIDIENDFDKTKEGSMAAILKGYADEFAAKKEAQEREKQIRLNKVAAHNMELNNVRLKAEAFLRQLFAQSYGALREKIDSMLASINLDNIEEIRQDILVLDTSIPESLLGKFEVEVETIHVTTEEKQEVVMSLKKSKRYAELKEEFEIKINDYKQQANLQIPAIREELEKLEIAKKENPALASRIEKSFEKRAKVIREESKKQTDSLRKTIEQDLAEKESINELQAATSVPSEVTVQKVEIRKKVNYKIELVMPGGLAELFRFWLNESKPDDLEKAKKWTIARMIGFAEKQASKYNNFIKSEYVIYNEKVSAKV